MASVEQVLAGRYRIMRQIGAGGTASVYCADDLRLLGRSVAIKEMSLAALPASQRDGAQSRFLQEAQLLARLTHPGLTAVTDFFEEDARSYLVMDFVPGQTLDDFLKQNGSLPPTQVADWARQLCEVFTYLHTREPPVIFRDLKPSNIMVTTDNRLKLIDFGIARLFKTGQNYDTQNLGTPGYAAPEQYGRAQTDKRTDVYSLGVVVHQMLTGYDPTSSPFNLPSPSLIDPGLDPAWDRLIAGATAVDPQLRYQTAADFCADLPKTAALAAAPTVAIPVPAANWPTAPLRSAAQPVPAASGRSRPYRSCLLGTMLGIIVALIVAGGLFLLANARLSGLFAALGTGTPAGGVGAGTVSGSPLKASPTALQPLATQPPATRSLLPVATAAPARTNTTTPSPSTAPPATPVVLPPTTTAAPIPATLPQLRSGPTITAQRCPAITVDGQTGDWNGISNVAVDRPILATDWSGPADLSAKTRLCWDPNTLYLLAEVTDDRHIQRLDRVMYLGDALEIQFDADLAGDFAVTTLNGDDYQIGLSAGDLERRPPEVYRWLPTGQAGVPTTIHLAVGSQGSGYTLEAAIPWAELGVQPATGSAYGLCINVADADQPNLSLQTAFFSTCPARTVDNPTTWGNLILQP